MKPKIILTVSVLVVMGAFALRIAGAQSENPAAANTAEVAKIIKAAADALGMPRWSTLGGGALPAVDAINRVDFRGNGTTYGQGVAFKTDYRVQLSYRPPAMRVEITRTNPAGGAPQHTIQTVREFPAAIAVPVVAIQGAPQHTIQAVREAYAWDESEMGAGLEPGRGIATPAMGAVKERLLQLWILPYGVVKAAAAAGDKAKESRENGATVISFPLSGELAGITVEATLDAKNLITEVRTRAADPALSTQTEYSNYADLGTSPTEVLFPGHIVRKQGGHPVLDIQVKAEGVDISPYLVFPVPASVKNQKKASAK
jgi:hypothetical protein